MKKRAKPAAPIRNVLDGEGMMEMDGKRQVMRKHDVIYIPPGVSHAISNTGLGELTFIVVTTPADDKDWRIRCDRPRCAALDARLENRRWRTRNSA